MQINDDYIFDSNGINIVDNKGDVLADIRNDYSISKIAISPKMIRLSLRAESDTKAPDAELNISGTIEGGVTPEGKTFEGLYDISAESLNLCVDDSCYLVKGDPILVEFKFTS